MPKDALIRALMTGDQATACTLIDAHRALIDELFDDLTGIGRQYHLVHIAAFTGQQHVLEKLIELGADVNDSEPTHKGWTPLHFAAQHRHPKVARILCHNGADASITDSDGKTALDFATQFRHRDIVEIIESGG